MKVILCVLTAFAVGVLLVGCTSECKRAAQKLCEYNDDRESREQCVAGIVLAKCSQEP